MNLKRLIVASVALAALSPGVWADDVTDTYLVNPSFEILKAKDGTTDITMYSDSNKTPLANGLYGWEVIETSNYQVESFASGSSTGFPTTSPAFAASEGTYYYFNRQGWGSINGELKTTTSQAVPKGLYYFVFDYKAADYSNESKSYNNGTTLGINVYGSDGSTKIAELPALRHSYSLSNDGSSPGTDSYMVDADWKEMGILFEVSEEQVLTFSIVQNLKNWGRSDVVYDNCRLIQVDENIDIKGMIANYDFEQRDANGWTNGRKNNGQQYTGAPNSYYQDAYGATYDMYQTITLPAGVYQLKAATRAIATIEKANIYSTVTDSYDSENYATDITAVGNTDGELGNGWGWTTTEFVVPATAAVKIGFYSECADSKWAGADTYSLTYLRSVGTDDLASLYAKKVAKAQSVIDSKSDDRAEEEKEALQTKMKATPTSYDDIAALKDLVDRYEYAVDNADEIAEAEATQGVKDSYTYSYGSVLSPDITTWESCSYSTNNGAQHWSGAKSYKYYEQQSNDWGSNSWSRSAQQSVTLPAGKYAMFIAARASSGVTSTMSVKVGENDVKTVTLPSNGDTGHGIDVDGKSTYSYDAIYANDGVGRGWKYKYIEFEVEDTEKTVVISFNASASTTNQWVSIANPMLYGQVSVADVYKKTKLNPTITTANAVDIKTNVGDNAFQISTSIVKTFTDAIAAAQSVSESETVTADEVLAAVTDLNSAVTAFENAELTAPEETTAYNLVLNNNNGWTYDGKAVTFSYSSSNANSGGYGMGYNSLPGASNYVQAVYFKKVADKVNTYVIYIKDEESKAHYICTGSLYSGSSAQLRVTEDEASALNVLVIASSTTDGVYQLKNTEAGALIGSKDVGFYTVEENNNFNILPATEKSVERDVAEGKYATIILPYAAELSEGTAAYSVTSIKDDYVVLEEAKSLEACTPYIIGEGTYAFSGLSVAKNATYASGLLTGVLVETAVPSGSYVLQTKDDAQAFYVVGSTSTLKLGENRAYLTSGSSSAALRISFDNEGATGIRAVEALTGGKATIYDLNGRKLDGLRKGINIVDGVKVFVK